MAELVLGTRNKSKAAQIRTLFAGLDMKILSLDEAGVVGEAVEDGATLEENARKKAWHAWKPGRWALADDTGLFIDALDGAPGVHAARWAGEGATAEETLRYTLWKLTGIPLAQRTAIFRTIAVVVGLDGLAQSFMGEVRGILLESPRAPVLPSMSYSSIFVPEGSQKVWSEMTIEEENSLSHRGKAFRQALAYIRARSRSSPSQKAEDFEQALKSHGY